MTSQRLQRVHDAQGAIETIVDQLVEITRRHRKRGPADTVDAAIVTAIAEVAHARELLADLLEDLEEDERRRVPT